jgi:hypothetical protein
MRCGWLGLRTANIGPTAEGHKPFVGVRESLSHWSWTKATPEPEILGVEFPRRFHYHACHTCGIATCFTSPTSGQFVLTTPDKRLSCKRIHPTYLQLRISWIFLAWTKFWLPVFQGGKRQALTFGTSYINLLERNKALWKQSMCKLHESLSWPVCLLLFSLEHSICSFTN